MTDTLCLQLLGKLVVVCVSIFGYTYDNTVLGMVKTRVNHVGMVCLHALHLGLELQGNVFLAGDMRVVVALHTAELAYLRSITKGILDLLFRQIEREADGIPLALDKTLVLVRILQLGSEHEVVPASIVATRLKTTIILFRVSVAIFINHPMIIIF